MKIANRARGEGIAATRTRGSLRAKLASVACGAVVVVAGGCAASGPVGATGDRVLSRFRGEPLAVVAAEIPAIASVRGAPLEPSPQGGAQSTDVIVAPGDTLWSISRRVGVSVAALAEHNGISDVSALRAGTRLKIPGASDESRSAPAVAGGSSSRPATRAPLVGVSPQVVSKPPAPKPTPQPAKTKPATVSSGRHRLQWPVEGEVTSRYGERWGRAHDGIDIGAPEGSAVCAAAEGEVLYAAEHGSYGNLVVVKHPDDLFTVYAHNDINLVRKGQQVDAGQMIAKVGATGRATGPHLHFEVRRGTKPVNPMSFLPP